MMDSGCNLERKAPDWCLELVLEACPDLPEGGTEVTSWGPEGISFRGLDEALGNTYEGFVDDECKGSWHYTRYWNW